VAEVVLVLGTSGGGVGRHVRSVAAGLVSRGRDVLVVGPAGTEAAFGFTGVGAAFAAVDVAERPRPRSDAAAVRELRHLLLDAGVAHAHGLRAGALAALALVGVRRRPPLVVTLHNAPPVGGGRAATAAYAVLERVVARRADVVLGVSPDLEERMRRLGARQVGAAVVPAPLSASPSRPVADVRAELGAAGRPILLTVARLAEQKGLSVLMSAAAELGRRTPPPLVVVAGGGPLEAALRERVAREGLPVVLLGPRDDVPDLLAAADVVVVPSRWEGQPIFVQEALRAGRPLVATATGGTARVVGDAAVLVPYGDPGQLAGAVAALLDSAVRRSRLSELALRRAGELPSEAGAVDVVDALHARVRGSRPRRG
jgi:glycosyltransferase involved in cell wall biosynthesis